jgi:deferrochelatase/peroxidase EfeB
VRRANPRDALEPQPGTERSLAVNHRHRLLRRGRTYGAPLPEGATDAADRGIYFIALNANISRQFEFVQHSWLIDPRFNGLYGEADPIAGAAADNQLGLAREPTPCRFAGLPRFVQVTGGAYFFLPSLRALTFLSELC